MDNLGKKITVSCLAACGLVVAIGLINGQPPLQIIRTGISLAVGAIPEGLPAVVTIAMAFGVHRMARKNMVVRKLNAVETLGSATVICTDKTGTLTKNEMTVTDIVGYSRHWQVTGEGYLPQGRFHSQGRVVDPAQDAELRQILSICTLCNNAGYDGDNGHIQGDPTEAALKDPPKPGVKQAVAKCRRAGVKVLMITGDHPATGMAIARQLDILRHGRLLTGSDIEKMSEEALGECLERVEVCARATPEHKLRIVRVLKRNGHVVAMTGDGVNDAPAVKEADVGIAMG
ncbi:MAG: HAD-IC family P-type ATPase [Bacillota bacterium]